ncbi:hypothetical protein ACFLZW_06120 [Chloroflexota bacterium]
MASAWTQSRVAAREAQRRESSHPDSVAWQRWASAAQQNLATRINITIAPDAFHDFVEAVWPDDDIELYTWREIEKMASAAMRIAYRITSQRYTLQDLIDAARSAVPTPAKYDRPMIDRVQDGPEY